jgi:Methyltransferase domain
VSIFNHFGMNHFENDIATLNNLSIKCINDSNSVISRCIEVGSWVGQTALVFERWFRQVYCIDAWDLMLTDPNVSTDWFNPAKCANPANIGPEQIKQAFGIFCSNCKDHLYKTIIPCRGSSHLYASIWPFKVDMIFIDATHTYEEVKKNINEWLPHLLPGGTMAFHDYGVFAGVNQAIDEMFPKRKVEGTIAWEYI